MASSRLTFLYPHLFRTGLAQGGRWAEPAVSHASHVARRSRRKPLLPCCCQHAAPFTTPSAGRQAAFARRAGKGVEPQPFQDEKPEPKNEGEKQEGMNSTTTQAAPQTPPPPPGPGEPVQPQLNTSSAPQPELPQTIQLPPPSDIDPITQTKKGSPMDELLHMGPPPDSLSLHRPRLRPTPDSSSTPLPTPNSSTTATNPPHLTPTPYVHHFDSYTLVKHLTTGGYTLPQAISSMKAIRTILASNLDVAQSGLVSKADMENESYLFRAACSELGAEVHNNRRVADEQLRQQRTLLHHEVDILAQRLNQDLLTLNDNVRGMFNDRKMVVREEQKAVESRIQQINYKISVTLNSDAKSNIEGLRWVLIRRSVLGIIFMAVVTLGTIRYATYIGHKHQKEAAERKRAAKALKTHDGKTDSSPAPDAAEILAAN
ncbi:hypothetical protein N0V88_001901 [Collariella sp. IMI 366227]|nr:hypothetical protein N0V88_001901 [Collariella sp. IMI 366227]